MILTIEEIQIIFIFLYLSIGIGFTYYIFPKIWAIVQGVLFKRKFDRNTLGNPVSKKEKYVILIPTCIFISLVWPIFLILKIRDLAN